MGMNAHTMIWVPTKATPVPPAIHGHECSRYDWASTKAVVWNAVLGDDADTTAAICGQLVGAYYGVDAIPADWLGYLYRADDIRALVRRLATSKTLGCCS